MELQERVKAYANENGIKLGFIAKKVGLFQSQLSEWLHGKREIEDIYKRKLDALINGEL